jgi:hypothetical protein
MVSANFGPPRPLPPVKENTTPIQLPANVQITGKLVLEIVPVGDKVRLIVPKTATPKGDKPEDKKPEEGGK